MKPEKQILYTLELTGRPLSHSAAETLAGIKSKLRSLKPGKPIEDGYPVWVRVGKKTLTVYTWSRHLINLVKIIKTETVRTEVK